jgi:hypothetical protein
MLQIRNVCGLAMVAFMFIAASRVQADSQSSAGEALSNRAQTSSTKTATMKNASLNLNGDCCQTAPAPAPECKTYQPCVIYRGCCDCCGPKATQVLKVKDPSDCCCCSVAEIPVCLPTACKDPKVCSTCGLLGRGIVTYSYDCGCCVTIIFRNCGDVIVKYE